jgi:site-specific recombinase XerD
MFLISSSFARSQTVARAPSTLAKYRPAWAAFQQWLEQRTMQHLPFAAPGPLVALYLQSLLDSSTADCIGPSRVQSASATISCMTTLHGFPLPTEHAACQVVRQAANRSLHATPKVRLPITVDQIRILVQAFASPSSPLMDLMHCTAMVLMFAGFMRFDDLAEVSVHEDLLLILPSHASVFIPKSKTDQTLVGTWIHVTRSFGPCCPVALLERLLLLGGYRRKPSHASEDVGPLLRGIRRTPSGHSLRQLVGTVTSPVPSLSYSRLLERCHEMCRAVGLSENIALHSMRIGGATGAVAGGADIRLVQRHGRWLSGASMSLYIRDPLLSLLSVSAALSL